MKKLTVKNILGYDPVKVQTSLIQRIITNEATHVCFGAVKIDGEDYYMILDEHSTSAFIVPVAFCWLDKERIFKSYGDSSNFLQKIVKGLIEKHESRYRISKTGYIIDDAENKCKLIEYSLGDTMIYFNEKLLSQFVDCELYCKSAIDIAVVYKNDILVGCICPVRRKVK